MVEARRSSRVVAAVASAAWAVATSAWAACTAVSADTQACTPSAGVVVVEVVGSVPSEVPMSAHTAVAESIAACDATRAVSTAAWASTTA